MYKDTRTELKINIIKFVNVLEMEDNNLQGIISMFSEERWLQCEYENRCIDNLISIDLGKNIKKSFDIIDMCLKV